MIRLLQIEFMKLWPYRSFRVLFIIYILLQLGFLMTGRSVVQVDNQDMNSIFNVLAFPNIWNYYLYFAGIFNIILGILVIFITTNEYSYKTIRQNVIDGLSRNEVVAGKILLLITLALFSTLLVFAGAVIAGMNYTDGATIQTALERSSLIFAYFVQCICLLSLAFLFGTIFKRSGVATLLFLVFIFPLDVIINKAILRDCCNDYLPVSNMFVKLINSPYVLIRSMGEDAQSAPALLAIAVGLAYTLLFFIINWQTTKKRDL